MGKSWIDLFATKQSLCSHVPDGRTYSVDALTTHWGSRHVGLCVSTTCTVTQDLIKNSVRRLNSPAFLQAPWFQTLLSLSIEIPVMLPANRRMLKQPLSHVFHPQSEALCPYALTLSQNQKKKNFRQRQNYISATAYILLLC